MTTIFTDIIEGRREGHKIFEDEKKFIYKIDEENKLNKIEVVTGIRKDGNLEVLSGLSVNELIVKEGLSRLNDGMIVRPITN